MKKFIAILTFSFLCIISYSQETKITVTWGPEQKGTSGKGDKEQSYLIGEAPNEGKYILREKYKYLYGQISNVKRFLEHYDKNGNRLRSEKIIIRHKEGDRFFDGVFFNDGRMYLVTFHLRRNDKMNVLSVQNIDTATMLVDEHIKAVAEVPYKRGLFGFVNQYTIKMLGDRIYVFHAAPEKITDNTLISIHVFDLDFNLKWKFFKSLEFKEKLFQPEDFDVDQNGTVRVLASIYKDKKRKVRKGKPNYEYHFFAIDDEGKKFKEHSVLLGDKFITDMRFTYRANGDIACAGFYSDKGSILKPVTIAGAFYLNVDPESDEVKLENTKAFDEAFLSHFMTMDAASRGKEIKNISLRELSFLDDGSAVLLAEEFTEFETSFSITSISYSYGPSYYTKTISTMTSKWSNFHFDNIIALRINTKGEIEWANILKKKQHTIEDVGMYSSFAVMYYKDRIFLIYNDNPKNLTAGPNELYRFRKNKNAVVVCAEIRPDGSLVKKALFNAREAETLTCPRSCKQISENKMEIYGKKRGKYKFGEIEFH